MVRNEIKKDLVYVQQTKESQELTFESWGVIACGRDSYNESASFTSLKASDGAILHSSSVMSLESEKMAHKRFKQEIKNADKIIELSPYLTQVASYRH